MTGANVHPVHLALLDICLAHILNTLPPPALPARPDQAHVHVHALRTDSRRCDIISAWTDENLVDGTRHPNASFVLGSIHSRVLKSAHRKQPECWRSNEYVTGSNEGFSGVYRWAIDASIEGLVTSVQGQELLAALVGFIQPIIRACAPADDTSQSKILLDALKSFVKTALSAQEPEVKDEFEVVQTIANPPPREALALFPSLPMPDQELENELMSILRPHVFNTMPIRMLAFDSSGSGIRLVDRNEVIDLVFRGACAEAATREFQHKFANLTVDDQVSMPDMLIQKHSRFAILSHTWMRDTPGDVVFGDWHSRTLNTRGYSKIAKLCEVAAKNHGVALGWMDTVCINKESSSELDESIRSMYKWYQGAHVCVSYMSETETLESMHNDSWFTRGWTLQELLAPTNIQFYDREWDYVQHESVHHPLPFYSTATSDDIQEQIEKATSITTAELSNCRRGRPDLIPASRKFQLAAKRNVTRAEDQAYSLMGLLDVDISVAYGEGAERALYRLQREILATKKNPLDIFNCSPGDANKILPSTLHQYVGRTGQFDRHSDRVASTLDLWTPTEPLLCTHLGVRMQVLLIPGKHVSVRHSNNIWHPKGNFSGQAVIRFFELTYLLLHEEIYNKEFRHAPAHSSHPPILYFGVINFAIDNDFILLPDTCLAVPLDCGTTPAGTVTQTDIRKIWRTLEVVTFHLKSVNDETGVAMKDLEGNGMQLVTLYL